MSKLTITYSSKTIVAAVPLADSPLPIEVSDKIAAGKVLIKYGLDPDVFMTLTVQELARIYRRY